jgi:hypothetical protein
MENLIDGKPEAISGTLETQLAALFSIDSDRPTHHQHNNRLGNTTINQLDSIISMPSLSEGYAECNNCNTQNPINHKYCIECGAQLSDSTTID